MLTRRSNCSYLGSAATALGMASCGMSFSALFGFLAANLYLTAIQNSKTNSTGTTVVLSLAGLLMNTIAGLGAGYSLQFFKMTGGVLKEACQTNTDAKDDAYEDIQTLGIPQRFN